MRGSGIMLRRLNDALPGLVLGIIVYGAAVFLAGIWFVPDKLRFTTGLAIGIAPCLRDGGQYGGGSAGCG